MNVTYVSALYKIYETIPETFLPFVSEMLSQSFIMIVFVDSSYFEAISKMSIGPNIRIILKERNTFPIYNMCTEDIPSLKLPNRSVSKDTPEYMALMNTKIDFIREAKELCNTEYVAWLDAGISKIFKDKENSMKCLNEMSLVSGISKIIIPGAYLHPFSFEDLSRCVRWVFLGGLIVFPKKFIEEYYPYFIESIQKFIHNRVLVWEVNIWVDVWQKHDIFLWFSADHNDTMIRPPQFLWNSLT